MRFSRNIFASPPLAIRHVVTNQNGMALVLALVTMLLVSMMGLFGAVSSQTELTITKNEEDSKKALNVAEAGVRHALQLLANGSAYQNGFNDELSGGGTGGGLTAIGGTTTYPGDTGAAALLQYRFASFGGSATGDGYYVRAIDNHDSDGSSNTDIDQRFILISRGKFGTAEKTIEALIAPPTPCAITVGDQLNLGGNVGSTDIQVNTTDGFGACAHANGPLNINGSVNFPDGASSSLGTPPGSCSGNPNIGSGNCNAVLWSQPQRELPNTNPGQYGEWVAEIGNAYTCPDAACVNVPFYILHTVGTALVPILGHSAGQISKGGGCYVTTTTGVAPIPKNAVPVGQPANLVGRCGANIPYADGTSSPAEIPVTAAEVAAITARVAIAPGTCTFNGNLPPGVYYCDGLVQNQGQVNGPGVTIISRDDMSFTSQTNLTAFLPNVGNATLNALTANFAHVSNPATPAIKALGQDAWGRLQNLVMMSGNDLDFSGNNTTITGIILVHNEINMTGGKTITGYLIAADGLPAFTGDPHPAGSASTINPALTFNRFTGSSQINYMNFGTANPMGAPVLRAWNDGQW